MLTEHLRLDAQTRAEIEALVIEHAWLVDHNRSEALADLYTENGRLIGIGPDRVGREALLAYGRERATMTRRKARHVVSNLRLVPVGPNRVLGTSIITLFRADGEEVPPAEPIAVADIHEIFTRDEAGRWAIAERRLELIFESEAHRRS